MKKRTAVIIVVILAAVALAAAPLVFAGPGGHRGMRGHGMHGGGMHGFGGFGGGDILGHLRHVREELDLSDAQVDQIKAIVRDLHEQNAANREQMRDGFHDAAHALLANPNDLAGAQAILDRQLAAEKTLRVNMLTAMSKALNVLTAEQRTKLAQLIAERHEQRGQRRKSE